MERHVSGTVKVLFLSALLSGDFFVYFADFKKNIALFSFYNAVIENN